MCVYVCVYENTKQIKARQIFSSDVEEMEQE